MSAEVNNMSTPLGTVTINGPVTGKELAAKVLDNQLSNFRPAGLQQEALIKITEMPRGRIYTACRENTVIGYVAFHLPDECSRWCRNPRIQELGGIEVARDWRCLGVGSSLLDYIFKDDYWEEYLVITTEYFRHWDLKGNSLTVWQYRNLLDKFFGRAGFIVKYTTDPDILEHPANVLMCRVGCRVPVDDLMSFEELSTGRFY
ncbi:acetyltransferase AcuA [Desulfocucumis palustris]|uniref:Acetyltransferase AcuA n=1 Tax=Desulfocucumis palustris TaxID=1898651 RepID=A0A2L2XBG3_9FIRM|nr:GNAT family N-acetyltransferase [Desulfocucumis palustris]GBF33023.1 acetyltransferase AcuA [Desulfocucumis palustris]